MQRINLGAGTDARETWVNVDIVKMAGINVVHDLNILPWPFEDESAEEIRAIDILEHVYDPVAFVTECWRILRHGGFLFIQTPRYDAAFLWDDPSHKRGFTERSMDFFDSDTKYGQTTGFYSPAKFRVSVNRLSNLNLQFEMIKR